MDELDQLIAEEEAKLQAKIEAGLVSWMQPYDAQAYLAGERRRPDPDLLIRSDGRRLLYRRRLNEIHAPPEAGKGFIAGKAAAEVLAGGESVVYLDFDQDPGAVIERIQMADRDVSLAGLSLHTIDAPLPLEMEARIRSMSRWGSDILDSLTTGTGLVVIDGVNTAMSMHGMSALSEMDYADFARLFAFRFRKAGATVLLCDHVPKAEGNNRYAYGTVQKLAVLDGAVYEVRVVSQPAPGTPGELTLVVAKDRPGGVRTFAPQIRGVQLAATVRIDGGVTIDPPTMPGEFKPTWYMEQDSRFLETQPEPVSQNAVERGVGRKAERVREALSLLVRDGYVKAEDGPNRSHLYTSIRPYREGIE